MQAHNNVSLQMLLHIYNKVLGRCISRVRCDNGSLHICFANPYVVSSYTN